MKKIIGKILSSLICFTTLMLIYKFTTFDIAIIAGIAYIYGELAFKSE